MEVCTLLPEGFSVMGEGDLRGIYAGWSGLGCRKGEIPSHGF